MDAVLLAKTVRRIEIVTRRNVTEVFCGNYKSSFRGQGLEVDDLREYADGDDARHIDWITTAKQGRPFVRRYRETRELTTVVALDCSASMRFSSTGTLKSDAALMAASTLLFSAFKNNDLFGALLYGHGALTYIPPRKGRMHLLRIIHEMVFASSESGISNLESRAGGIIPNNLPSRASRFKIQDSRPTAPDGLPEALARLNAVCRKRTVCFLVGDEIPTTCDMPLRIARRRHDLACIRVYDPFERVLPKDGTFSFVDAETGQRADIDLPDRGLADRYHALRAQALEASDRMLKNAGVDRLDISTADDVHAALLSLFKKRQARH